VEKTLHGTGGASYSLSSAAAVQIRRKLLGRWAVTEHRLGDDSYLERFVSRSLRDPALDQAEYRADYEFKEHSCLKHVEIRGSVLVQADQDPADQDQADQESADQDPADPGTEVYRYVLAMASAWDLDAPGVLVIVPELGYQRTELGGSILGFKELEGNSAPVSVSFRFEGESLILEEGDDFKRLERMG